MKIFVEIRKKPRVSLISIRVDNEPVGVLAMPPGKASEFVYMLQDGVDMQRNCGGTKDEMHFEEVVEPK